MVQFIREAPAEDWQEVEVGITRQVLGCGEGLSVARVRFEQGAEAPLHSHSEHSQSSYVESGVFEVEIDGRRQIVRAGDGYFAPKGLSHSAFSIEGGTLLDIFSPARLDF